MKNYKRNILKRKFKEIDQTYNNTNGKESRNWKPIKKVVYPKEAMCSKHHVMMTCKYSSKKGKFYLSHIIGNHKHCFGNPGDWQTTTIIVNYKEKFER